MGYDYSISLEGLRAAENQLNNAARKVSRPVNCFDVSKSSEEPVDHLTLASDMDIAGAMVEASQAKIIYKANLKMVEAQLDMEEEALDICG